MGQIRLTSYEAILYITLINLGIGILIGLLPLILGFIRKKRKYAMFGFLGAVIGGAILGIFLSIPIAGIFTWLILKKDEEVVDAETVEISEDSVNTELIENSETPENL